MKLDEFAGKLAAVADEKLIRMLEAVRREGPEIAVPLVEAEARRRGLIPAATGKASSEAALPDFPPSSGDADARVRSAFAGLDRPISAEGLDAPLEPVPQGEPSPGAWLTEEMNKSRLPMPVKVVLYLALLGGLGFAAYHFLLQK